MRNIRKELLELVDEEYREFDKGLCTDTKREILGIRVPALRKIAKDILKQKDWLKILNSIKDNSLEEVLLQGIIITNADINIDERIKLWEQFIPKIDGWKICDLGISKSKVKQEDLEKLWKFIIKYKKSKKEFEVRFLIVMMLYIFLFDEYIDRVFETLSEIKHEGYYVKMATAWCLATAGVNYYDKTMKYIKTEKLDKFTYNKALQKMIESYRFTNKQKELFRKMKK